MNELEKQVADLLSPDDEVRKKAASDLSNADLAQLSSEMVATLNRNLDQIAGDQNLTIRYFARKLKKKMKESGVLLGAEPAATPSPPPPVQEKPIKKEVVEKIETPPPAPSPPRPAPAAPAPASVAPKAARKPVIGGGTAVCSKCEAEMPDSFSFCGICGAVLDQVEEMPVEVEQVESPAAEKAGGVVIGGTAVKKENFAVKSIRVLLIVAFTAFFAGALWSRLIDFKDGLDSATGPIYGLTIGNIITFLTTYTVVQLLVGVLFIELMFVLIFRKTLTGSGLFKLLAVAYLGIAWASLFIAGPIGKVGLCSFGLGATIWSYTSLFLVIFFAICFVWRNGKKKTFIKLLMTLLGLYAVSPLVLALIKTTPFTTDLYLYDKQFLGGLIPIEYVNPLYFGLNVFLPLVLLQALCVLVASPFKGGGKALLGALFSLILIAVPLAVGQHLYVYSPEWEGHSIHSALGGALKQYAGYELPQRGFLTGDGEVTSTDGEVQSADDEDDVTDDFLEQDLQEQGPGEIINFAVRAEYVVEANVTDLADRLKAASGNELVELEEKLSSQVFKELVEELGSDLNEEQRKFVLEKLNEAIENIGSPEAVDDVDDFEELPDEELPDEEPEELLEDGLEDLPEEPTE